PTSELAGPPPAEVQKRIRKLGMMFEPLTPAEVAQVRVTGEQARRTALAYRWEAYDAAAGGVKPVIWQKVGRIYLGMLTQGGVGGRPPPHPYPAYLVQTL